MFRSKFVVHQLCVLKRIGKLGNRAIMTVRDPGDLWISKRHHAAPQLWKKIAEVVDTENYRLSYVLCIFVGVYYIAQEILSQMFEKKVERKMESPALVGHSASLCLQCTMELRPRTRRSLTGHSR